MFYYNFMQIIKLASVPFLAVSLCSPAFADDLPIRGIVKAVKEAGISSDIVAAVKDLPFREGETFKQGDALIKFDCADLAADKKVLEAQAKIANLKVENNKVLRRHGAIGEFDVAVANAEKSKAAADVDRLKVELNKCVIKAPFNGTVDEVLVTRYETPSVGTPLMRIVGSKEREVELIVPSAWLSWLKIGADFKFVTEETGKDYDAKVVRLGAVIDPISQTVQIFGKFTKGAENALPGMSGAARFIIPQG